MRVAPGRAWWLAGLACVSVSGYPQEPGPLDAWINAGNMTIPRTAFGLAALQDGKNPNPPPPPPPPPFPQKPSESSARLTAWSILGGQPLPPRRTCTRAR